MRYWLFQNNQVTGPYDREDLASAPGFSAESLVCPEGRKGTQMGDWQRAGVITELADTLLKMSRVPAGALSSAGTDPGGSLLPPEPTLRDLAVLGTLQEKVGLLENSLSQLREELRSRDNEIAALKVEVSQKAQEAKGSIEESSRREAEQGRLVETLRSQIEGLRSEIAKLDTGQSQLRHDLQEGLARPPAPAPAPERFAPPEPIAVDSPLPPPAEQPAVFDTPGAPFERGPVEEPAAPPPQPLESLKFTGGAKSVKPLEEPGGLEFADLTEAAAKRKKGHKGLWAVLFLLAGGAGAVYYLRATAAAKRAHSGAQQEPSEAAAPEAPMDLQKGLPDRTQEAIDFAKSYSVGNAGQTLSSALEGPNPPPGLSPWMVEKLDGQKYRVNFYPQGSKKPSFEFEVRLDQRSVRGLTDASRGLLDGSVAGPAAASSGSETHRRKKRKKSDSSALGEPLGAALAEPGSQPPARKTKGRKKKKKAAAALDSNETVLPADDGGDASPAVKSPKKNVKEEMSLDDLLLPGVPKRRP